MKGGHFPNEYEAFKNGSQICQVMNASSDLSHGSVVLCGYPVSTVTEEDSESRHCLVA